MICQKEHISEIALCNDHFNYNNIHEPPCPNCRKHIQETAAINLNQLTPHHKSEYIFHTRHTPTGSTIINCED